MLTGIGGGMVRDILVVEIPTLLRTELYAVAALIGAAVVVLERMLHLPTSAAAITGQNNLPANRSAARDARSSIVRNWT